MGIMSLLLQLQRRKQANRLTPLLRGVLDKTSQIFHERGAGGGLVYHFLYCWVHTMSFVVLQSTNCNTALHSIMIIIPQSICSASWFQASHWKISAIFRLCKNRNKTIVSLTSLYSASYVIWCCGATAAEPCSNRSIACSCWTHSSKPAAVPCGGQMMGRTDRRSTIS